MSNVYKFYNAFDLFILPSKYEGLGIVAIESQFNNLPTFLSNYVPKEVSVLSNSIILKLT